MVRIFCTPEPGTRYGARRLLAVLEATSLRKALEEYAKSNNIKEPVFAGNTMSGSLGSSIKHYEAQEAK
jgi:hypothetical protein